MIKNRYLYAFYFLFIAFYLWMAAQIPYTHDDWDWGLDIGMYQFLHATVNSRYMGNFFEIMMTRSEVLKTLIMGAGYFLVPLLITKIAFETENGSALSAREICFAVCNIMLLAMDRKIWSQTYGWVAGYANFVISSVFLLVTISSILRIFDEEQKTASAMGCIGYFLISFLGQLFLENIAIFVCLLSVAVNLIVYLRRKQFSCQYVCIMVGALLGVAVIFGNNIYLDLWDSGSSVNGVREVFVHSETNIVKMIEKCLYQAITLPYQIWENNLIICLTVIVLLTFALYYSHEGINQKWRVVFLSVNMVFAVYILVHHILDFTIYLAELCLINGCFYLMIAAEMWLLRSTNKAVWHKILFVWMITPFVILPLVVTNENGPRLFFTTNILFVLCVALLTKEVYKLLPKRICIFGISGCIAALALLMLFHGKIYYEIGQCKVQRDAIIREAVITEPDYIYFAEYPNSDYLWLPDPGKAHRVEFFKEFYGIPDNTKMIFESQKE